MQETRSAGKVFAAALCMWLVAAPWIPPTAAQQASVFQQEAAVGPLGRARRRQLTPAVVLTAGRKGVRERQDVRLRSALDFLESRPENPKALAMGAFACVVLASRDDPAATPERIRRANEFVRLIQRDKQDDRNTYWILPLLSRLAADPALQPFLEPATRESLRALLFPACDAWFTLEDARTDEQTVWHLDGSDNHDAMRKQTAYLTAQFLAGEPRWEALRYRDGHTAVEHRDGWARFFREYFRQRALRGVTVEMASPCYAGVQLYPLVNLYDAAGDEEIRRLAEQYLHVFFADAAQESLLGVRGGAKTRAYKYEHVIGYRDKTACYSWILAGLPEEGVSMPFESYAGLATSYRLPRAILELYHMPLARGTFESVTVRAGRGTHQAPPVVYQVVFPSLLRRTSFVTPRWVLGTFTTDETLDYTMLISQNHWMGLIAADALESRVVLTAAVPPKSSKNHNDLQAVQKRGTALFRRHNRCAARREMRAFVSDTFTLVQDSSGWVVARNGDDSVFVGIRASDPSKDGVRQVLEPVEAYGTKGTWVRFINRDAVIAMECASADEVGTLDAFVEALRGRTGEWVSDNAYEYPGRHAALTMFRDTSLPRIDGQAVDLEPERIYDSPYLVREQGAETVHIRGVTGEKVKLEFLPPE